MKVLIFVFVQKKFLDKIWILPWYDDPSNATPLPRMKGIAYSPCLWKPLTLWLL